jgi:N-acetylglucosaminyldiphosphoundecaprenol N-acetyl-beta-D-mannosaminyltransferase
MPVIWLAHAAGLPLKPKHRITLLDSLTLILEEAAISRWRVFYLGGQESVLVKGLRQLRTQHPGLIIDGHNGFFRSNGTQNDQVVSVINDFAPDILFVGMGMPLQELWLANNHSKLAVPVTLTCGATLEYITGDSYRPPTWAGPLGLYGIFRLLSDPRRLWHRYLYEPLALLPVMASAVIRQRLATLRR